MAAVEAADLVRGFPYPVFYVEREADIDVWRVLHGDDFVVLSPRVVRNLGNAWQQR